jgi:hypothetical protein
VRIGFASIFSFRPHVEHLHYVAMLARQAGHETRFLSCDGQLELCYARALKGSARAVECPKCMLGGIRSFAAADVSALPAGPASGAPVAPEALDWAFSSACTVLRTEALADTQTEQFGALQRSLARSAKRAYESARSWIEREGVEAIVCFNGRMEATRGVVEAARSLGLPYLTIERTWFGDGIQFGINDNVLGLAQLDRLNAQYRDRPLSEVQTGRIARHLASRFLRNNALEWRAYNIGAEQANWPVKGPGPRLLILPSSRNEIDGHPHWQHGWGDLCEGIDAVMDHLRVPTLATVIRFHPNWAEAIGRNTGAASARYYAAWAARRGVHVIDSGQRASTLDLISEADIVLVTGGSAAFEASALGKPVVSITPSTYQTAGLCTNVYSVGDLSGLDAIASIDPRMLARQSLRYGYCHQYRFSQYVEQVRAVTTTRYEYFEGADAGRLERMLRTGLVEPDDASSATDDSGESRVLDAVQARRWEDLLAPHPAPSQRRRPLPIGRRPAWRWIDAIRARLPLGDR